MYFRRIETTEDTEFQISEEFVSGALVAFSHFFKEILGTHAKLTYINASSYEFLFSSLPDNEGTIALVTSKANYFILFIII